MWTYPKIHGLDLFVDVQKYQNYCTSNGISRDFHRDPSIITNFTQKNWSPSGPMWGKMGGFILHIGPTDNNHHEIQANSRIPVTETSNPWSNQSQEIDTVSISMSTEIQPSAPVMEYDIHPSIPIMKLDLPPSYEEAMKKQ